MSTLSDSGHFAPVYAQELEIEGSAAAACGMVDYPTLRDRDTRPSLSPLVSQNASKATR